MKMIGSRQFRENTARYLKSTEPVLVTRHNRIAGVFLPLDNTDEIPDCIPKTLAETLANYLDHLIGKLNLTNTELENVFNQLRYRLTPSLLESEINQFIDEHRDQCLWFLASDYYPDDSESIIYVLDSISKQGDLKAYKKAEELKQWHLHLFNRQSVVSCQKTG